MLRRPSVVGSGTAVLSSSEVPFARRQASGLISLVRSPFSALSLTPCPRQSFRLYITVSQFVNMVISTSQKTPTLFAP